MTTGLDGVLDSYEFGWNITRSVLAGKGEYGERTIFGDILIKKDIALRREMEAERLFHKYSKMLLRREKSEYCRGALDFIREWDIIGACPAELTVDDDGDWEDDEEESKWSC